jgi:predicted  nucleic acid-binding Zn-ribbon protein
MGGTAGQRRGGRQVGLKTLLNLQALDLKIDARKKREAEIPRQKEKFDIHRKRLAAELAEADQRVKSLQVEQREAEGEIAQKQEQIRKYDGQLLNVKKNEEYQALLHEIEIVKKQIAAKEERIIAVLMEIDEAKAALDETKTRIAQEQAGIDAECAKIDVELQEAVTERKALEQTRGPLAATVPAQWLSRYERIRKALKGGDAVVPLNGESCSGCFMMVTAQTVNEILAGENFQPCRHCGRLLYSAELFARDAAETVE